MSSECTEECTICHEPNRGSWQKGTMCRKCRSLKNDFPELSVEKLREKRGSYSFYDGGSNKEILSPKIKWADFFYCSYKVASYTSGGAIVSKGWVEDENDDYLSWRWRFIEGEDERKFPFLREEGWKVVVVMYDVLADRTTVKLLKPKFRIEEGGEIWGASRQTGGYFIDRFSGLG